MPETIVIYHKADFDGIFCREIARKFLPEADLIGWDYGDPVPAIESPDSPVYMLDISIPELMGRDYLVWIDHHKSAIEKFPHVHGYQIDGVAACRLAWQWFSLAHKSWREGDGATVPNPNKGFYTLPTKEEFIARDVSEPLAVRLAGEYDIWDKRDPNSELFQHGLRSQEIGPALWALLLADRIKPSIQEIEARLDVGHPFNLGPDGMVDPSEPFVNGLLVNGKAIQYAKTHENESIIKAAGFTVEFEGLKFLACNHARYNSHLFTAGLKPEHDACLGFAWRDNKWTVSLYHAPGKEHHDLSLIASKYGGGGHRGACGFQVNKLPFLTQ